MSTLSNFPAEPVYAAGVSDKPFNSVIGENNNHGLSSSETITKIENTTFHGNSRAIQFHSLEDDSLSLANSDSKLKWKN